MFLGIKLKSWEDLVKNLSSDENLLLSTLPQHVLTEIINYCKWNKTEPSNSMYAVPLTQMQKLGWTWKGTEQVKQGQNQLIKYEIGNEAVFAMELLFNSKMQQVCLNRDANDAVTIISYVCIERFTEKSSRTYCFLHASVSSNKA